MSLNGTSLATAAQTQSAVYLWLALIVAGTSVLLLALACCDCVCCTEVIAAVIHVACALVYLGLNAWVSVIVFQNGQWPASLTTPPTVDCNLYLYTTVAVYCICYWVCLPLLPPVVHMIVVCFFGCCLDSVMDRNKDGNCCARQRGAAAAHSPVATGGAVGAAAAGGAYYAGGAAYPNVDVGGGLRVPTQQLPATGAGAAAGAGAVAGPLPVPMQQLPLEQQQLGPGPAGLTAPSPLDYYNKRY